jgi:hypothetical protein
MTLTRDQFEQSKRRRSVLAACVQALLITKHFLFGTPPPYHTIHDMMNSVQFRSSFGVGLIGLSIALPL